jgi:DNA-binding transcriptional LysR family regulator
MVHRGFPQNLFLTSQSISRFQLKPQNRVRADDMQTIRTLSARGTGIALLPDFPDTTRSGELVRVLPDYGMESGTLYFVYPPGKFTPVNVKAFIDMSLAMADAE